MSNFVFASGIGGENETTSDVSDLRKIEIEVRLKNEQYNFTREGNERVDTTLKRIGLKLAQNPTITSLIGKGQPSSTAAVPLTSPSKNVKRNKAAILPVKMHVENPNGVEICLSTPSVDAFTDGNLLCIREIKIPIVRDPCRVLEIQPPKTLVACCPAIPTIVRARAVTVPHLDLRWTWRVSREVDGNNPSEDTNDILCDTMMFIPPATLEGATLKVQCTDAIGTVLEVICPEVVLKETPSRLAASLPDANAVSESAVPVDALEYLQNAHTIKHDAFRVVTYNILHDNYASTDTAREKLYPYVPMRNLEIGTRKLRIAQELLRYNADITALQEVGRSIFHEYLLPVHRCLGAEGYFESKSRTETSDGVKSKVALDDGCAILWNTSMFECLDKFSIPLTAEFFQDNLVKSLALDRAEPWLTIYAKINTNRMVQKAFNRLVMKGIIVHLRHKSTSGGEPRSLLVANTHLFWHPCAKHIRIIQVHMLLSVLEAMRRERFPTAEIVLCGDLNSMPDGAVYQLLSSGILHPTHSDWEDCALYNQERLAESAGGLAQLLAPPDDYVRDSEFCFALSGIKLRDTCSHWDASVHTNFTPHFKNRLDYIFHSENISCLRTLRNPSVEAMEEEIAIPSSTFPSDHVAVVADLCLK